MIKNSIDFNYAIDKITTEVPINVQYQPIALDSSIMNATFKNMEESLNTLYEKTRYIEDSIQYAKIFLDTKVEEFNASMTSIIQELESALDITKNLSYISYNVPLKNNDITYIDRNGDILSSLIIKNNNLTLGYEEEKDIDISSITTISDSLSYDNTLTDAIKTKSYKTIFLEEKAIKNGLVETIIVTFKEPVSINVIDFISSNCSIKNIRFGLINGIEENAYDYDISINNKVRVCIYVKFDLVCSNYNIITYEIDKNKITENIWNEITEFETAQSFIGDSIENKLKAEYIISRTITNKVSGENTKINYKSSENISTTKLQMYCYIFGLDKINFKYTKVNTAGCFVSDPINIGKLTSNEYVSLMVDQVKNNNCSIEYSLLDGDREIPILPINEALVENELIRSNLDLRFEKSSDCESDIIRKNGHLLNSTYEEIKNLDGYTLTYKTRNDCHNIYNILNDSIRIKCCIRTYESSENSLSYIKSIKIKKYGEDSLWINKY